MAYLVSRMRVVDEVNDYERYMAITFIDFLDALGRIADMKMLPTKEELAGAGFETIFDWHKSGAVTDSSIIVRRASSFPGIQSERALAEKVELLLEIIARAVYYDPKHSDSSYSIENCIKLLQKIDKSLGS